MSETYIKLDDAREAIWRILNGMGISQKHNDSLVEEVEATLDEYPTIDVQKEDMYDLDEIMEEVETW